MPKSQACISMPMLTHTRAQKQAGCVSLALPHMATGHTSQAVQLQESSTTSLEATALRYH